MVMYSKYFIRLCIINPLFNRWLIDMETVADLKDPIYINSAT